jgi:anti-anti-sigma factor
MSNLSLQEDNVAALSGVTRLRLQGTLDIATIGQMEAALARIRTGGVSRVIVDLSELEYISSSGLGSFLGVVDHFRRDGGDLAFVHLGERIKKIFKVVGFHRILTLLETESEAIQHFSKSETSGLSSFILMPAKLDPHSGEAFDMEIQASDAKGRPVPDFSGEVSLRPSAGIVSPSRIGPFVQGVWKGQMILTGPGAVTVSAMEGEIKGEASFEVLETKAPASLPVHIFCPGCKLDTEIKAFNVYRCNQCDEIYFVDKWAHAISLRKSGVGSVQPPRLVRFSFPADVNLLSPVRVFIVNTLRGSGYPEDAVNDIELCADEAVTNVVEHAYGYDPKKSLTVELVMDKESLKIVVRDQGRAFEPKGASGEVDLEKHIAERRTGGLGVYLMNSFMDSVDYQRVENENVLTMTKRISRRERPHDNGSNNGGGR